MAGILLLNGPNLNLLGLREPAIYGSADLRSIETKLEALALARGHSLTSFQSNAEHELIAKIHAAERDGISFVIINPGAYTHTALHCATPFSGWRCPSSRSI
jgi:3-dehydroquinate dehydratase-2